MHRALGLQPTHPLAQPAVAAAWLASLCYCSLPPPTAYPIVQTRLSTTVSHLRAGWKDGHMTHTWTITQSITLSLVTGPRGHHVTQLEPISFLP